MSGTPSVLKVGLRHSERLVVEARHTVPRVAPDWAGFDDMPPVLATAILVGFIERTCIMGLRGLLLSSQRTVGTHVNVSHVAPTPVGGTVTAEIELVGIDGKSLHFNATCHDDTGLVSEGSHQRAVIDFERFCERVASRPR
jgi:fluoroacetyl-CoA thioesterase